MALTPGTRLGVYEVTMQLGAGGMGEVYRAIDSNLKRSVAIKVLPASVAGDTDRLARFQREAEVLAALNHPNIGAIYGLEKTPDFTGLVMELVEGEDLSQRIARGAIPLDEALPIAKQIADALEAAHEQGIIHRDLKPANIKVRPDGTVKVLDFGLAKAMDPAAGSSSTQAMNSPTLSMHATQAGIILGTAAYMAPEQARGKSVDKRADIWAFGVVLFEMLTGIPPFPGEDISHVLARVIERDPEWSALPPALPPALATCLRRCLVKDPRQRIRDIGDVRLALEGAFETKAESVAAAPNGVADRRPLWRRALFAVLTAVVAVALTGAAAWVLRPTPAPPNVTRFPIVFPDDQPVGPTANSLMAIAPDGSAIVTSAPPRELRVRRMADLDARAIAIGEPAVAPFFSPDGQWIGYSSPRDLALKKVAITGGAALTICKTGGIVLGAVWEGDQIYYTELDKGILRVSADGGEPEVVVPLKLPEAPDTPQVLDHGKAILFTLATDAGTDRWDKAQVVVQPLPSGPRKVILRGGSNARYVTSGHLVFVRQGTLLAVPFDLKTLQTRGGPVPVVEGLMGATNPGARAGQMNVAVSASGTLAYIPGGGSVTAFQQLRLVDRAGKTETLALPPAAYSHPRFSPNGKQLVYATDEAGDGIVWVYDIAGGAPPRRLTFVGRNTLPIWTPDGRRITFGSARDGNDSGIYWQPADGTGAAERLIESGAAQFRPEAWTPDGKTLAFLDVRGAGDIFTVTLGGDQKPKPLVQSLANERYAAFSPDGRWFAYSSSEMAANPFQVYVEPYPPTGAKYQLPAVHSRNLVWSPDGRQAFYFQTTASQGRLMAVDVRTQPSFGFGKPTPLPIEGAQAVANGTNYDITPDGKRFVVVMPVGESPGAAKRPPAQINVVLNWIEELKQRVPTK